MRSRVVCGAALLLLALPSTTAAAAHPDRCRPHVVDLGTLPGGNRSIAFAMSGKGVLAGWSFDAEGAMRPVRWADGHVQELKAPAGREAAALDINRSGVIVGRSNAEQLADEQALVWRHGRLSLLPGFPGSRGAAARRISDSGLITGSAVDAAGRSHAVLWVSGRLVDLGLPRGFDHAFGIDVTDDAEVVVHAYKGDELTGFRWERGRFQRLDGLRGDESDAQVAGAHGETAGLTWHSGDAQEATIWDHKGRPRSVGVLRPGDSSAILATDGAGGYAGASGAPGAPPRALLVRGRGPLRTLQAPSGPDGASSLRYLDREGNAAGIADAPNGQGHATLWTCVWRQAFVPAK